MSKTKKVEVREWDVRGKKLGNVKATAYTETDNAVATSRVLDGSLDVGYYAEYVGYGVIRMGRKQYQVKAIYLFSREDMDGVEDEGDLDWDNALRRFIVFE